MKKYEKILGILEEEYAKNRRLFETFNRKSFDDMDKYDKLVRNCLTRNQEIKKIVEKISEMGIECNINLED